jgi:HEAT repeat protein
LGPSVRVEKLREISFQKMDNEFGKGYMRVIALAKARDVDGLIVELRNPAEKGNLSVRALASSKLSKFRTAKATGPLIELLESDPNEEVRNSAARALGMIGSPEAVGPLIAALEDPYEGVRYWAATGLGDLGDPLAVPALVNHLVDDKLSVRRASAAALAKLRDPAAIGPLAEAVKRENFRRRRPMKRALRRLKKRAEAP